MVDIIVGIASFLGLMLFMGGLIGSNHAGQRKEQARMSCWLTLLGTAFLDVSLFYLQFDSNHHQAGADGFVVFLWGVTIAMALMTVVRAIRPYRLRKQW
jgi:hypothetical protein